MKMKTLLLSSLLLLGCGMNPNESKVKSSSTVNTYEGEGLFQSFGLLYVDGDVANAVYDYLDVEAYQPEYSPTIIKEVKDLVKCQKNEKQITCQFIIPSSFQPDPLAFVAINEQKGKVVFNTFFSGALLNVEGEAAKLIFEMLPVEIEVPVYSSSEIKSIAGLISCTKNGEDVYCQMSVPKK